MVWSVVMAFSDNSTNVEHMSAGPESQRLSAYSRNDVQVDAMIRYPRLAGVAKSNKPPVAINSFGSIRDIRTPLDGRRARMVAGRALDSGI